MERGFFTLGAALAFIAVAAGAFGAHGLRDRIAPDLLPVFETAVRYQMYHAIGLLIVGLAIERWPANTTLPWAAWLFVAGTVIFSGTLYVLSLTGLRWLGAITPLGGLAFLAGWILLAWSVWRN